MPSSPTLDPSPDDRVKLTVHVSRRDRNWLKAAASLDGMGFEEWLYALAVRRAQEMELRRPLDRKMATV